MRFKRFCSLSIAAAIGMSILAGTAAAKETTTGVGFDFNQNDGGFTPIFSDYPNEQGVEDPFFPTTPTSRGWRNFMSFAPAMRRFPLQTLERDFSSQAIITATISLWDISKN